MKYMPLKYTALFMILSFSWSCFAQEEIRKEVVVVKNYKPVVSEASKINLLPEFEDTLELQPEFNYILTPRKIKTDFELSPIQPANLLGEPLDKLYKTYLKLGLGNHLSPLGELSINSLRSKDRSFGFYLHHNSTNSDIRLENDQDVYAAYGNTEALLYAKQIRRRSVVSGDIQARHINVHHYGYNPSLNIEAPSRDSINQQFFMAGANLNISSAHVDSSHLNYRAGLHYDFAGDRKEHYQNHILLRTALDKLFGEQTAGIDIHAEHLSGTGPTDSVSNNIISLKPWLGNSTRDYKYVLGADLTLNLLGDDLSMIIHPRASLQFNVVEKIMVPYLGVGGSLTGNPYAKIARENPFITPGLVVRNTNRKLMGYAGVKGNISPTLSYDLSYRYGLVEDMHFYVNDTLDPMENTFVVDYDDVRVSRLGGTLHYQDHQRWDVVLKAFTYDYTPDHLLKAWHKPDVEIDLYGTYNMRDKIIVNAGFFLKGRRYARDMKEPEGYKQLNAYLNFHLGLEYRYTKILSAFIQMNQIIGSDYLIWNQYPSHRFRIMAGFSYAL